MRTRQAPRGFTMLELLVAMSIFTILGTMTIFMMNRGLEIFRQGTRQSASADKLDAVLPPIEAALQALMVVPDTDAPPLPPSDEEIAAGVWRMPMPRVDVRLVSQPIRLARQPDGPLKDLPMPYFACVLDISGNRDPVIAGLPVGSGPGALPITPGTVEQRKPEHVFLPAGGAMEVCWIAAPTDPRNPSVLTLFHGYRAPIGDGANSLLDPSNLDTIEKIQKACRPVAEGVLHFGVTWRRAFATSWDLEDRPVGTNGELTRYVGSRWDSTRGFDKDFAMFAGKASQVDPSDDVFPAFVRLEITIATATTQAFRQGECGLVGSVSPKDVKIRVDDLGPLMAPVTGRERWLKVGAEWMGYDVAGVDPSKKEVRVRRGQRGTKALPHESGAWVRIGTPSLRQMRLPVFKDRLTLPKEGRRR